VRFLVDENLPPELAALLTSAGHEAVHVRDVDLTSAPDSVLLDRAATEDRVIVSADTDFGGLLAQRRATRPSVVLVRAIVAMPPAAMGERIIGQLAELSSHLSSGAIVALTRDQARVRRLPLP
jgi:predicted nuclease of predicted toxin-antitoxin system